jgi:hypothetical protein
MTTTGRDPVEALLGPRPYNDPPSWPEIATKDEELRELLQAIKTNQNTKARAFGEQKASPARQRVLIDILEKLVDGWKSTFYPASVYQPHASKPEINAEYNRWYQAMVRRGFDIKGLLSGLGSHPSKEAMEKLYTIREATTSDTAFAALGSFLVGERQNNLAEAALAAPRPILERIAAAFEPDDRGFADAVRAVYLLEGSDGLRVRIDRLLGRARNDQGRRKVMEPVSGVGFQRLFAADPSWIDRAAILLDDRAGFTYQLEALGRLDLWLRTLRFSMASVVFDKVADALKEFDDLASAKVIREIAATLPLAPTKHDGRSRSGLERLASYLERDRKQKLPKAPARMDGIGTDGGPILLLTPSAAKAWKGVPDDYDRACNAPQGGRAAVIQVGGEPAIVLPEQSCTLAKMKPSLWVIVAGQNDASVWNVLGPGAVPFEPLGATLDVEDDGLLLLDAAFPGARPGKGRKKPVKLAKGRYRIEELHLDDDRGNVHIVRLHPDTKKPARR